MVPPEAKKRKSVLPRVTAAAGTETVTVAPELPWKAMPGLPLVVMLEGMVTVPPDDCRSPAKVNAPPDAVMVMSPPATEVLANGELVKPEPNPLKALVMVPDTVTS